MRVWTKDEIKSLLETSEKMVVRSVVKIYEKQTKDEQTYKETNENNGVGFNGVDAGIMSSFAERVLKGKSLTEKQMVIAKKKIVKYAGQLTRIANNEI